ncbi:MAG TPA: hypothetical protein ENK05_02635 [Gammaproteobacteria bacterium]|nr:hypothetical protein [Gammaproteobacteria bacterium]
MNVARAFDFGDMMNPGDWFNSHHDDDYYYDRYRYGYGPYGWGGPYGYGPYGGWGGPYGYAPYGWGGYPGYGYPGAVVVTPQTNTNQAPPPKLPE